MDDSAHLALNDGSPTYSSHSYHTEEALDVSIVSSDIFPFCKWTVLQDIGSDHLPILVELKWKQLTQLVKKIFGTLKRPIGRMIGERRVFWKSLTCLGDLEDFPVIGKKALIIPIRKSSKKACYPESFRPIALTNFSFRDSQNLRPSHHTVAVFLDLSKAFDRVWRNKLIIKLFNTFGIRDRALSWIFDFLKDREIRVRFRDSLSKTFRLSQGVPQGSVLSPLLFSLYIAGIEKIISRRCEVGLFADDIVLWNSNSDVVHIETAINTTLSDIQSFAEQHKLIFNVSKSTSSFFTTNRRLYNYQPQIFMESKSLPYEKHPKYLGYILDPEILSNKHINYVINKGRKRLDLLKYIAGRDWGADAGTLRLTYTSLIRPVLEYGSQIYFSASRTNLAKLDRVQSSAARIITGMRHSCPTDLVLFEADIMPLDLRKKLLLSKYFCKLYSVTEIITAHLHIS
ncbi:probable RNA-directed DNA polymerase from transposon BS [Trichonephila clavipes]|nr:probable RNA-directed DNA polymerase from transposon BS [Trichonephila clavipes]